MSANSRIEWTDASWNPITGCTPCSPGCANCWAKRMATRLTGRFGYPEDEPFRVTFHRERLDEPQHWKKPRRVFVCSMGDLWHPDVKREDRAAVIRATNLAPQHTYLFLSKRPENFDMNWSACDNFWLGVTVENNDQLWRVDKLCDTPAAHRFVSYEPALGPLDLRPWLLKLGHVIVGPETGPQRRPCDEEWIGWTIRQCREAGVPCFVKAFAVNGKVSKDPDEWPEWARVRELPEMAAKAAGGKHD